MDIKPVKKRRRKISSRQSGNMPDNAQGGGSRRDYKIGLKASQTLSAVKKVKAKNTRLTAFFKKNYLFLAAIAFLCFLYFPSSRFLDTSNQYQNLVDHAVSIDSILNNAAYMPQKLFVYLLKTNGFENILILKFCMFLLTTVAVYLFYKACLNWYGRNAAIITTLLFASSTWVIMSSQSLVFSNIYLLFFPLVIYLNHLFSQDKNIFKIILAVLLLACALYSPGMLWPLLGMIAALPFFIKKVVSKYDSKGMWLSLVLILVVFSPLIGGLIIYPRNFSNILTGGNEASIYAIGQNLQSSAEALFFNGLPDKALWLSGTPILNYLVCLLLIFGVVCLFTYKSYRQHLKFLVLAIVFSLITIAFVGLSGLALLIPVVYMVIGFGIKLLLDNWYALFPNNPFARNVGFSLVIVIALLAAGYDVARYYIVWPKHAAHYSASTSKNVS